MRSKSRMYCRVSSMILGLSSFSARLCPAITALGFSDSILSRAAINSRRFSESDSPRTGGRRCKLRHPLRPSQSTEHAGTSCCRYQYVRAAQRPNHAPLGQSRFRSVLRQSHDGRENLTGKERIPERLEGLRRCLPADNLEHIRRRNKAGARKSL